jgi:hypothetical protein
LNKAHQQQEATARLLKAISGSAVNLRDFLKHFSKLQPAFALTNSLLIFRSPCSVDWRRVAGFHANIKHS